MLHKPTNGFFIIFALMLTIIFAGGVAYAQKADTGSGKISIGSSDGAPGKGIGFGNAGAPSPYSRPSIGDFGRSRPPSMVELPDDRMSRKQAVAPTNTARSKQFKSSSSTVIPFSAPPNLGSDPFDQAAGVGPESIRRVPLVSNEPTKDPQPASPATPLPIRRGVAPQPTNLTQPTLLGWAPDSSRRVPEVSNEPTKDPQPASPATPLPIRRGVAPQATKLTQPRPLGWAPDSPRRVPLVSNEPTKDPEPAGLRNDSPRRVPLVSNEPTKDPEPASPATQMLPIRRDVAPDSPRRVPLVSNEPTKDPQPARAFRMNVVVTDPYENAPVR